MVINDLYRRIRSAVRELGCRDSLEVVWAYSRFLQRDGFKIPNNIQVHQQFINAQFPQSLIAEFSLELIAREVIRYADIEPRRGCTLRKWGTLAEIVNLLKDLEQEIYLEFQNEEQIHLELMRIAHRQFLWQQHPMNWRSTIRYYKLFNTPEIAGFTQQATGLSLDEIYIVGMLYLGHFSKMPRVHRNLDIQIPKIKQEHLNRFLDFTSLTRNGLGSQLRSEHILDEGFVYRYSSLREFPLVRMSYLGQEEVICPIPTLLFWRITTGLYYTLTDINSFTTEFGRSFQRYVGEVLRARITSPNRAVLEEQEYQIGKHRKDTVDWIVQQGEEAALFIECKIKRLTWASKAGLCDLTALQNDLEKLADAVVQVYKTIVDYQNGCYPQMPFIEARQVFPVIVTLEDWYFFGKEMPERLDALVKSKMEMVGLPDEWLSEMPYCILSIDELESVSGALNTIDIVTLILEKVRDAKYSQWSFSSYCKERFSKELPKLPPLFRDDYDALFAGLIK